MAEHSLNPLIVVVAKQDRAERVGFFRDGRTLCRPVHSSLFHSIIKRLLVARLWVSHTICRLSDDTSYCPAEFAGLGLGLGFRVRVRV